MENSEDSNSVTVDSLRPHLPETSPAAQPRQQHRPTQKVNLYDGRKAPTDRFGKSVLNWLNTATGRSNWETTILSARTDRQGGGLTLGECGRYTNGFRCLTGVVAGSGERPSLHMADA